MHEYEGLYIQFKGLIIQLCKKYYIHNNSRFSFEDLISEAKVALLKANNSFDNTRDVALSTYVYKAIDNELRKFVSNNSYDIKITEYEQRKQFKNDNTEKLDHDGIAISVDNKEFEESNYNVFASGSEPPDVTLIRNESLGILREELELLPDRERFVIESI